MWLILIQSRKAVERTKADFDSQNQALSEDLPKFIDGRIEYIQPCLESLIKTQVWKINSLRSLTRGNIQ